jgi:hypothetical protein
MYRWSEQKAIEHLPCQAGLKGKDSDCEEAMPAGKGASATAVAVQQQNG